MTDKQIIIDDCIHLNEWKHCDICEKLIKTKDGANGKKREHLLTEEDLRCDFYPNCYCKQLKRKEQECEKAKQNAQETYDLWQALIESFNVLQSEKIKLEQECEELQQFLSKEPLTVQALQSAYSDYRKRSEVFFEMIGEYKQTLTEIKEIIEPMVKNGYSVVNEIMGVFEKILQKIKEVQKSD